MEYGGVGNDGRELNGGKAMGEEGELFHGELCWGLHNGRIDARGGGKNEIYSLDKDSGVRRSDIVYQTCGELNTKMHVYLETGDGDLK